jgi:UDP-glucose 4-epimerase
MRRDGGTGLRVLVTGGAGYVGSHVCAALVEAGHAVTVLDDLSEGHRAAVDALNVPLIAGDVLSAEDLDLALGESKAEAVVHMAAKCLVGESVEKPELYWRVNVVGSLALTDAMARAGAEFLVFSSSAAVYGQPEVEIIGENAPTVPCNPYGRTKLVFEQALAELAAAGRLRYAALRYFNAAGAHSGGRLGEDHAVETHLVPNVLRSALNGSRPMEIFGTDYPTADGTAVRDYVHVEDLARAHVLALERLADGGGSLTCNLGTGSGNSVRQVVETARRVTGRDIPAREASRRAGDPARLVASNALAAAELGWKPQRDLTEVISSAWRWHSEHPSGYNARPRGAG